MNFERQFMTNALLQLLYSLLDVTLSERYCWRAPRITAGNLLGWCLVLCLVL